MNTNILYMVYFVSMFYFHSASAAIVYSDYTDTTRVYEDVAYSSKIKLDFKSNYYNVKNVSGDISFTAANHTNGSSQAIRINKATSDNVDITFATGSFINPAIKCVTTHAVHAPGVPALVTLSGAGGEIFFITCEFIKEIPYIFVDQIGSENAVVTAANQQTLFVFNNLFASPENSLENAVVSFTIPANTLKSDSQLKVNYMIRTLGAKDKVTFKCKISDTVINELTVSDNTAIMREGSMYNNGSLKNQNYFLHNMHPGVTNGTWPTMFYTSSIDFSKPVIVSFTIKKLSAEDKAEVGFITLTDHHL